MAEKHVSNRAVDLQCDALAEAASAQSHRASRVTLYIVHWPLSRQMPFAWNEVGFDANAVRILEQH